MITFLGEASVPIDNGSLSDAVARALPPIGGMQNGDFVYVVVQARNSGAAISIVETGGQTWVAGSTRVFAATGVLRSFWCQFNGTWTADPSWETSTKTGVGFTVAMVVFRPTSSANNWESDVAENTGNISTPSTPFDVTATGQTTTTNSTATIASFFVANNITFILQTGGWSNPGGITQWRNQESINQGLSVAYKLQTAAGATGNVTNRESSAEGGRWIIQSFREVSLAPGAAPNVGAIVVSGQAPSLEKIRTLEPSAAALTLQSLALMTTTGQTVPPAAVLSLAGLTPEIIQQTGPNAGVGTAILTLQGLAPTLVLSRIIAPSLVTAAGDLADLAPTVLTEWTAKPASAALMLVGQSIGNLIKDGSARIAPEQGALFLTGLPVTTAVPFDGVLAPSRTQLDLLGLPPEVVSNWIIAPDHSTDFDILMVTGWAPTVRGRVAWHDSPSPSGASWHIA